jgi:tetratricopeptide (TPR) repeat protein
VGQVPARNSESKAGVRKLFEQSRWQAVVDAVQPLPSRDADLDYFYGSALAQLGRLDEARRALLAGYGLAAHDKRFPIELAGVAFKQQRRAEAATWLRRGLHIDPTDAYANDFLGTVYFLEGNLEGALRYWNRVDKPHINSVRTEHDLKIRPALLDRALTFAPGEALHLSDLLTSRARLDGLGIFVAPNLQLAARSDGKFDVALNLAERNGFGNNPWSALLSTFSGIGYETVYPEYFNFKHSAINFRSLLRWDDEKRRAAVDVTGPLRGNPKRGYRLGVDLRNENWAIRQSFTGVAPVLGGLNLRREVGDAEIRSIESGRWQWSTGMEVSHRDYRNVDLGTALTPQLLMQGTQLKALASTNYELWRVPERRLVVHSGASAQLARIWSQNAQAYSKLQGFLVARWLPKVQGDDYATEVRIRGGGAAGTVPFDELYMLGMERDNDLWLRAHVGTRDGVKGSSPLGTRYFLSNMEVDKNLYGNGLFSVKLSPFLDTGRISGASAELASQKWLWDTGLQLKLRVLGVGMTFVWGKDLRTGSNAWYFASDK